MAQNAISIYEDTSSHKYNNPQYGLKYTFGDECTGSDVEKLNAICDSVVFKEHHCQMNGMYPDFSIRFTKPNIREHNVLFRDCPLSTVKRAANQIAKYLNVDIEIDILGSKNIITFGGVANANY